MTVACEVTTYTVHSHYSNRMLVGIVIALANTLPSPRQNTFTYSYLLVLCLGDGRVLANAITMPKRVNPLTPSLRASGAIKLTSILWHLACEPARH